MNIRIEENTKIDAPEKLKGQIKTNILQQDLDAVSRKWDISGSFFVLKDLGLDSEQVLYQNMFGYQDRDQQLATTADTRYIFDSEHPFFVKLCTYALIDLGHLKESDTLDRFLPEYEHASKIKIKHLLERTSGLPDFYYGFVMKDFENDQAHKALPDTTRSNKEKLSYYKNRDFQAVLHLISGQPLEYNPGIRDREDSETNVIFLGEILRRITQTTIKDILLHHILTPVGIASLRTLSEPETATPYTVFRREQLVRVPLEDLQDKAFGALFTLTVDDAIKLLRGLGTGKVLTEKTWQKLLKLDKDGLTPLFENANGYYCADIEFMGTGFFFYFNPTNSLAFASLVNEEQKIKITNDQWHYFRRDSREAVAAATTFPVNTRLVKVNKDNLWHALNLKVEEDQQDFVLEAKSSIAMGLLYPTKQAFVQMEGNLSVGLLVLDINPKKNYYNIDIILIDKRFQGRGYGKQMVKWAVDYLKTAGAKELKIGVNRYNYGAQKIYMAAGFTPKSVYDEGMTLAMTL